MKRAFKEIKSILQHLKGLSVVKDCLRLESTTLNYKVLNGLVVTWII